MNSSCSLDGKAAGIDSQISLWIKGDMILSHTDRLDEVLLV